MLTLTSWIILYSAYRYYILTGKETKNISPLFQEGLTFLKFLRCKSCYIGKNLVMEMPLKVFFQRLKLQTIKILQLKVVI